MAALAVVADGLAGQDLGRLSDAVQAERVLVEAARRLDPPRLRRVLDHLHQVADSKGADRDRERRHQRRGLWLAPTFEGMVAIDGLFEAEAGQTLLSALEPLARPADATDTRSGSQRHADALAELARRHLEAGRLPQSGGVRPQLTVTVDLDSLLGHPGALGGELDGAGPLDPRPAGGWPATGGPDPGPGHPPPQPLSRPRRQRRPRTGDPRPKPSRGAGRPTGRPRPERDGRVGGRLRAATALLPPTLGGAPTQPLEVGRTTRVIHPAQRVALAVRDGGCVFPDCTRPLAWCEAHHLRHWLHGGPTDLANLALLCRAHHRAVHGGGWRLARQPDGRFTATPPYRRRPTSRGHPTAA